MMVVGSSQPSNGPTYVSIIVDMDQPSDASPDLLATAEGYVSNLFSAMAENKLDWTLFPTKDASSKSRLMLANLYTGLGIGGVLEFGISGSHPDDKLSTKSYSEQEAILKETMSNIEATKICGSNVVTPRGFMPQSFDQNEDTYKVLDDLGIEYNTGFQAGLLYEPGHEKDVWPYKVENHEFYAVPISTYMLSGKLVPLSDIYAKDAGLSSSQWKDMLIGKFNEISGKDEPMVISLSPTISGSGEYLGALKEFLAFATSNNAEFILTRDLVNMTRTGIHESSEGSSAEEQANEALPISRSKCKTCDTTPLMNESSNLSFNLS